jgi:hypothetical protein
MIKQPIDDFFWVNISRTLVAGNFNAPFTGPVPSVVYVVGHFKELAFEQNRHEFKESGTYYTNKETDIKVFIPWRGFPYNNMQEMQENEEEVP